MPFGIGSLASNAGAALTLLEQFRRDLLKPHLQASTGTRIDSAAGDRAGLANEQQTSTELHHVTVQNRISLETLRNANVQFGFLNRFFNTSG